MQNNEPTNAVLNFRMIVRSSAIRNLLLSRMENRSVRFMRLSFTSLPQASPEHPCVSREPDAAASGGGWSLGHVPPDAARGEKMMSYLHSFAHILTLSQKNRSYAHHFCGVNFHNNEKSRQKESCILTSNSFL